MGFFIRMCFGASIVFFGGVSVFNTAIKKYESRAVANGCAIRVLDSASGEVKAVWKDGKP